MPYHLDDSVHIYKQRQRDDDLLIMSSRQLLRLDAKDQNIKSVIEQLARGDLQNRHADELHRDVQSSALIKKLEKSGIIHYSDDDIDQINQEKNKPYSSEICILSNQDDDPIKQNLLTNNHILTEYFRKTSDLYIVKCEPYDRDYLDEWNQYIVDNNRPGLFACVHRRRIEIGPFVVPGQSACFECLEQRLRAADDDPDMDRGHWAPLTHTKLPAHYRDLMDAMITSIIVRFLHGERVNVLLNERLSIDTTSFELRSSPVRRVPSCKVCGSSDPLARGVR